jgi:hypothetical protein
VLVFLNEWLLLVVVRFGLGGSIGNSHGLFQPFPPAACVCLRDFMIAYAIEKMLKEAQV